MKSKFLKINYFLIFNNIIKGKLKKIYITIQSFNEI